ncbi:glycosyltransferase [Fibrella sp. HMF5335]|uniref:Glycosyltransferase n=1 Tax=Fibrella rubiginis TaxID=2817060 RepID=A0A939GIY1_9BACT|nr:glycosyltransferase [Fibrella rubiginis]MBO0939166.1 glycosyltransferase [Fibrella rubiginis]
MIALTDSQVSAQAGQERQRWINRNNYYYKSLTRFLQYNVPAGKSVLEVGCGTGYMLNALQPSRGMGIDIRADLIEFARTTYPDLIFKQQDANQPDFDGETFDYIILSDTIGYLDDVQQVLVQLHAACHADTRLIITYQNALWWPVLEVAESIGLKMPEKRQNWLDKGDIANLLTISDFDTVRTGKRMLMPRYIPLFSGFMNRYVANLPLFNRLGLFTFVVARSLRHAVPATVPSVTVVVPARNEAGNIDDIVRRTPQMGSHTQLIFVEGNSTDNTWAEVQRVCATYTDTLELSCMQQPGKGKGDAVRKGYSHATGDILMILDADMTVPPEDLPKFYEAIASGRGEYINGSRLVYPMEDQAMRTLNIMGNKFFSMAFSWLLSQQIKDTLCGTKVMTQANYKRLAAGRGYFGEFDPFGDFDLIFGSAKLNLKFVEIPIRYRARTYGETNISRFKHGWLLLKMTFFALNKIKFV